MRKVPILDTTQIQQKSILLVKPEFEADVVCMFEGSGVQIHIDGVRYLGSVLGSREYVAQYLERSFQTWSDQLQNLSE